MRQLNNETIRELEHEGTREYCGIRRNNAQDPLRERRVLPVCFRKGDYILYNYTDDRAGCGKRAIGKVLGWSNVFVVVEEAAGPDTLVRYCILISDIQVGIVAIRNVSDEDRKQHYTYKELDVFSEHWEHRHDSCSCKNAN